MAKLTIEQIEILASKMIEDMSATYLREGYGELPAFYRGFFASYLSRMAATSPAVAKELQDDARWYARRAEVVMP